jgi:hypothetical protein
VKAAHHFRTKLAKLPAEAILGIVSSKKTGLNGKNSEKKLPEHDKIALLARGNNQ